LPLSDSGIGRPHFSCAIGPQPREAHEALVDYSVVSKLVFLRVLDEVEYGNVPFGPTGEGNAKVVHRAVVKG
jgi:hypothetical protein